MRPSWSFITLVKAYNISQLQNEQIVYINTYIILLIRCVQYLYQNFKMRINPILFTYYDTLAEWSNHVGCYIFTFQQQRACLEKSMFGSLQAIKAVLFGMDGHLCKF